MSARNAAARRFWAARAVAKLARTTAPIVPPNEERVFLLALLRAGDESLFAAHRLNAGRTMSDYFRFVHRVQIIMAAAARRLGMRSTARLHFKEAQRARRSLRAQASYDAAMVALRAKETAT
jgi:hypothetical protein